MSVVLIVPASVSAGEKIVITGTGFTHSGTVLVSAYDESEGTGLSVVGKIVADGSGNITTDGNLDVTPNGPGHVNFQFDDVTAVTVTETRIQVFQS